MPDWYNEEIAQARRKRDDFKRKKLWADFKTYRNKTKQLIKITKRKHFSDSVTDSKDTRAIWQHFRKINNKEKSSNSILPEEVIIDDIRYTKSEDIAAKLNEYFSSISDIFRNNDPSNLNTDLAELKEFVNSKVPNGIFFQIPFINPGQVSAIISALDPSKAIGIDGLGPRILKTIGQTLSPSIAALINKSILTGKFPSIAKVNKQLQADLEIAVAWSKQNKLPINYDKTTYMVLGTKPKEHDTYLLDLSADGNKIEKVPKQKLLGIVIDDHLSWAPHIDYLCSTISSKISLLRHISIYVPQNIQKIFYQSYIQPLLDYGCNTWGNTTAANIERLSKLQKRAARIILRADFMTPSTIMFERLEWLSVPKRLMYNKAVLTYKALNNLAPAYISGLLKPVSETHTRSLRSSENGLLSVPRSRTALYDRSFSYSASKLWNALPQSIRTKPSLKSFKTSLKAQFQT